MGILQHNLQKSNSNELSYFDKATLGIKTENTSQRPSDGFLMKSKEAETVLSEKLSLIRYRDLWNLTLTSDILQITFNTRGRKTFRQGFDIEPEFEAAPQEEREQIEGWINKCNSNGQTLKEVLIELDKDLNWADDAYMLCLKDYGYNEFGKIVVAEPKEFVRLHPISVELVMDFRKRLGRFQTNKEDDSQLAYTNPFNRSVLTSDRIDKATGKENIQAHYRVSSEQGFMYYNESEIMHKSAFNPSLTYGYSPLFSLYQKIMILMLQDSYVKKYYGDDKPTKGLLVFNTANKQALMKTFDEIRQKTQNNPHSIKPIVAESADGRKPVEYIDMAKTLDEMQYTTTRDEIRQQVGAMYGVQPLFQNDMSTGGGLNNEGLQITVTNEVIQDRQELFNNSYLRFVFKQNLGFDNWEVVVTPDIEQDEMAEEQLRAQQLANAKSKLELGLSGRMDKNGEIIFDAGDLELQEAEQDDFIPFQMSKGKSTVEVATPVDVSKASKKVISEESSKLNSKLDEELKSTLEQFDYKRKPSEETLLKKVAKVTKLLEKKLKRIANSVFSGIYDRSAKSTSKQIGTTYKETPKDKQAINELKTDPLYQEAFEGMTNKMSDDIRDIIRDSAGKPDFTIDKLVSDIGEVTDVAKNKVRQIARTESLKLGISAQQTQLEKTGVEYNYFHSGVRDNRTGEDSKKLMDLTKQGVSWEKYIKLTKQVAKQFNPKWTVNTNAPILHPNQRSKPLFRRVK